MGAGVLKRQRLRDQRRGGGYPESNSQRPRAEIMAVPAQVAVFARLPFMVKRQFDPKITTLLIMLVYAAVLYVWLNYAVHAKFWVPYQNSLFLN